MTYETARRLPGVRFVFHRSFQAPRKLQAPYDPSAAIPSPPVFVATAGTLKLRSPSPSTASRRPQGPENDYSPQGCSLSSVSESSGPPVRTIPRFAGPDRAASRPVSPHHSSSSYEDRWRRTPSPVAHRPNPVQVKEEVKKFCRRKRNASLSVCSEWW